MGQGVFKKYKKCLLKPLPEVKCDPTDKGCGYHHPFSPSTITISPPGAAGRKGPCGPVASTLLHELVHLCHQWPWTRRTSHRSNRNKRLGRQNAKCSGLGVCVLKTRRSAATEQIPNKKFEVSRSRNMLRSILKLIGIVGLVCACSLAQEPAQSSPKTVLLEVLRKSWDAQRTETLVYLRGLGRVCRGPSDVESGFCISSSPRSSSPPTSAKR